MECLAVVTWWDAHVEFTHPATRLEDPRWVPSAIANPGSWTRPSSGPASSRATSPDASLAPKSSSSPVASNDAFDMSTPASLESPCRGLLSPVRWNRPTRARSTARGITVFGASSHEPQVSEYRPRSMSIVVPVGPYLVTGIAELKRRNREEHADERSTHEVGKRASQDGLQT